MHCCHYSCFGVGGVVAQCTLIDTRQSALAAVGQDTEQAGQATGKHAADVSQEVLEAGQGYCVNQGLGSENFHNFKYIFSPYVIGWELKYIFLTRF